MKFKLRNISGLQALFASMAGLVVILWPRKSAAAQPLTYINTLTRDRYYGPIQFIPRPSAENPEGIMITNDFERKNIIRSAFPLIGVASVHRLAAPSLRAALNEIQRKGWAYKVKTFEGGFYPRFVRGSTSNLSSHSYGTSVDINAGTNPMGSGPTDDQRDLAAIFEKHGWYWGNRFSRPDPMHMEYVLPPPGVTA